MKILAQVFSYEICEISKNTFSHRTPLGDCFYCVLKQNYLYSVNLQMKKNVMVDYTQTSLVRPIYLMVKFSTVRPPCWRTLGKLGRRESIHN